MLRFIVGTGRCGSTLLSHMLSEHPDVLSISEFFGSLDRAGIFSNAVCSGEGLVEILSRSNLSNDFLVEREALLQGRAVHGYRKEVTEYARQGWRLPSMQLVLSSLTDDPEKLFAELKVFCRTLPVQPLPQHYLQVFGWLAERLGRIAWIERSGASIEFLGHLRRWYPDARFIHIHRDGPTTAVAVRAFRHFAMYGSYFFAPPSVEEMRETFVENIDPARDPLIRRLTTDLPSLPEFGTYWSWQIACGYREIMQLKPEQFMDIRYEDLIADTPKVLGRIVEFFDLPAREGWIERAAARVDPEAVANRLHELDPAERRALEIACLPGMTLLGRYNNNGLDTAIERARSVFLTLSDKA
jgi:hypothetical protein